MTAPLYVCVYVPESPAQALLRLRPELLRRPVVVLEGEPPLERVCAANELAGSMGVRHGMSRAELDSFPGVCALKRSTAEERSTHTALLEAAGAFTPRVEVQRAGPSAWAAVLDMSGSQRIFGTPAEIARRVERTMRAMQLHGQVAAASNLHAAISLARAARRAPIVVAPGEEPTRLAPLPLKLLGLTAEQTEAFALWGVRTLGELAALGEEDLIVRLGQAGKRLRLLARGELPHLMVPEEPVFALEEFVELDAPVELLDSLLFAIAPMLGQLIARAQNHAFALASVTVTLGLDQTENDTVPEHIRTIKPALPLADRELLLKLLHLDLDAHPPHAGVISIHLSAEPGDRSKVQMGLFSPQLPEPTRLDVTLARIAALVGEDRVGRAELNDTHRSDGFEIKRFLVPAVLQRLRPRKRQAMALRRLRPPVPITMRRKGVQPSAFYLRGTLYTVDRALGPWRRSGEWWSAEVWSTEEWDVEVRVRDLGEGLAAPTEVRVRDLGEGLAAPTEVRVRDLGQGLAAPLEVRVRDLGQSLAARIEGRATTETLLCRITHDRLRKQWQLDAFYD